MLLKLWPSKRPSAPPDGALPVTPPAALLARHDAELTRIRQLAGVPAAHWEAFYLRMFRAFAGFVQELPASEAHHHAGPGGLLAHGLEVTREALKLRRGHMLPAGEAVETVAGEQDLWTYAVAAAALLHDIGKPVADLRVALFDAHGAPLGTWAPWLGAVPPEAAWYRVTFVQGRRYRLHERLPALLAHLIVPAPGLEWLGSNASVLEAWLAAITGTHDAAGPLGEIVRQADRQSVAADLTGRPAQMPTARTRPLHERLLTGLRFLLGEGQLPLNRRGAAGWFTEMDLWLVSKRALDALRAHLEQEGQGGIPSRNERLMDELQQHGVIAANGDRAIWPVEVAVDNWRQELTTLRFPAQVVWPDPEARPDPFAGSVLPLVDDPEAAHDVGAASLGRSERRPKTPHDVGAAVSPGIGARGITAAPVPEAASMPATAVGRTSTLR